MTSRPQSFLLPPSSSYVGTLSEWDPVTMLSTHLYVLNSNEEIYVGRDPKSCNYVLDDPLISRRHLHIYTIIFDRDNPQEVAPLVYAQDLSRNGTLWNGYPMGKGNGSFLLSDGDILEMGPGISLRYTRRDDREMGHLDALQTAEARAFEHKYTITPRILGSGAYGKVYMAFRKDTGQQLACKVIDLRILKDKFVRVAEEQHRSRFFAQFSSATGEVVDVHRPRNLQEKLAIYDREAEILQGLSHPNIIGIEKVITSSNTIYLFQDLITAGDLFSYLQFKGGRLPEIEAAVIVRQVAIALDYLHDRNIVHRDLKPDNILMTSLADGCRVVLTDFGCARLVQPRLERMSTVVGTFDYSAPEVLQEASQGYTKAVDLWSLGCLTFVLLTGDIPFKDALTRTCCTEVARTTGLMQVEAELQQHHVGDRAADFVRRLLVFNEAERMDIKQALKHDWFNNRAHKSEFDALYLRSIKRWKPRVRIGEVSIRLRDIVSKSDGSSDPRTSQPQLLDDTMGGGDLKRSHTTISSSLSDPVLPPHRRTERPRSSQSFVWEGRTSPSQISSVMVRGQGSGNASPLNEYTESSHEGGIDDHKEDKQPDGPVLSFLGGWNTEMAGSMALERQPDHPRHGQDSAGDGDDEDEVYEEISNCITGMKKRLAYGSNFYPNEREDLGRF